MKGCDGSNYLSPQLVFTSCIQGRVDFIAHIDMSIFVRIETILLDYSKL